MPPNPKTASRIPSTTTLPDTSPKVATSESPSAAPKEELNPVNEWHFKVTGRGTSGWMSWVKEGEKWVPLRQSETSFLSAVTAIEPEIMRLAFPHTNIRRGAK